MNIVQRFLVLVVVTLPGIFSSVSAEPYMGLDLGKANIDNYESANSGFIFGGYQFENFAVEAGFVPLGYFKHETLDASMQFSGIKIDVVGAIDLNKRFKVFGKLGYYDYSIETKLGGSLLPDVKGDTLTYAVGVSMAVGQTVEARISYEKFDEIESASADRVMLGIVAKIF